MDYAKVPVPVPVPALYFIPPSVRLFNELLFETCLPLYTRVDYLPYYLAYHAYAKPPHLTSHSILRSTLKAAINPSTEQEERRRATSPCTD